HPPERDAGSRGLRCGARAPCGSRAAVDARAGEFPHVLRSGRVGRAARCGLFGPGRLEPAPLARLARDLFGALEGTKIGPVTSVTLRLETQRLVARALGSSAGQTTLLVVVGSMAR